MELAQFEDLLMQANFEQLTVLCHEHNIVDIAEYVESLDISQIVYLFKHFDLQYLGELFSYLSLNTRNRIKDLLTSKELSDLLDHVYTDDVIEFISQLPLTNVKEILSFTELERRKQIYELLGYPKYSAGSIMSKDYIEMGKYINVLNAAQVIKEHEGLAEFMDIYYITDRDGILEGIVSVRDILFAPDLELLENIMTTDVISVNAFDHQEDVAKEFSKYDFSFLPVVDNINRLVGLLSADDIIDVVEDEATEDIHKMGGISWIKGGYLDTPAKLIATKRVGWLLILTVAYTISSWIITGYDDLLTALPSLMIFVPLLMDTAGDAGSQSLAMVVRGIAVDKVDKTFYKQVLYKEFGVSLIAGAFLFAGNFIRIMFFSINAGDAPLAFVVSLTVFFVVIISKIIGGLLPLVALSFNQDPAVMASPLITTISDSISLIIYFTLATLILGGSI
ncbi:MAG: magnesium transporter [Erysipelothrix sp.]|nr:magnesium transporter [Erysipelothrix sp.]